MSYLPKHPIFFYGSKYFKKGNLIIRLMEFLLKFVGFVSRKSCTLFYRFAFLSAGKKIVIEWPILLTPQFIQIGNNVFIGHNARIQGISEYEGIKYHPEIIIEENVSVQQNMHLTCASRVVIKKNTAIAANVTITDIDHPYEDINVPPERQSLHVSEVLIGEDCKIYNNVVLLPGTMLGRHTVVAANSVVIGKSYPDYSILAGAPAVIKKRYIREIGKWIQTDQNGNIKK